MENTLEMMKGILTGKEVKVDEKTLIEQYKTTLFPNILAYFYASNYNLIYKTSRLYPVLDDEDIASFCLQELDKCLRNFDLNKSNKFITYFMKCFKNRLLMESEQLLTQKRKAIFYSEDYSNINCYEEDSYFKSENIELDNYNLSDVEKYQCKLLNAGYNLKEIAKIFKQSAITIYKRNAKIKQKFLNNDINFV